MSVIGRESDNGMWTNCAAAPTIPATQQALADPGRLPDDELFKAVDYGDGSNEMFLRRLWDDLYGDEPTVGS
jgi:hypothetical protein